MASLGDGHMDGHGGPDGRLGSQYQKSQGSELGTPRSQEQDGLRKANSHDSDALIHMVSLWHPPLTLCRIMLSFTSH